jgi:pyr_form_ly_1: formate acetyltransferase
MRRQPTPSKEWKWQQLMQRRLPGGLEAKAWEGFTEGNWQKDIDVRDFIQKNYTPYEGDESFLADATDKTKHLWKYLDDNYLSVERKQRVYDVDTHTPAGIDAFPAGYIDSPEVDNVIVGLQTDVPCKRAMMPNGGWRMVEQAIKEAGKEPDPEIKKIFTKYRKTHNDGVFGVYTKQIKSSPQQDPHRSAGCLRPRPHHRRLPSCGPVRCEPR